jgi:hypothetical protein
VRIVFVTVYNDAELVQQGLATGATCPRDPCGAAGTAACLTTHRRNGKGRDVVPSFCRMLDVPRVGTSRRPQQPGGARARAQEVAYGRTVMFESGRETYTCSVVSSMRGGVSWQSGGP